MKNYVVVTIDGLVLFVEATSAFEAAHIAHESGARPVMVREAAV